MTAAITDRRIDGGWKPALFLFLLAPMTGELITSSAPPLVFFIPWVFLLFALLYGCGAILVRELAVRWRSGWWGVVALGAAYGILEEGLGAKSFFDPHWRALGPLGSHGRWMGVNWVWTIGLIIFHAAFCIGASVLATNAVFARHSSGPWLSGKALAVVGVAYALVLLLFFQKGNENAYRAPTSYYLVCLAVSVFFVAVARWLGRKQELAIGSSDVAAWRFACLGFLAILSFVFLLYGLPSAGGPAWVTALLLIALAATVAFLLTRWSDEGSRTLSTWQQYALVAGSYGAFALQAPFQEFNPARGSAAQGMTLVGLACFCSLFFWRRYLVRSGLNASGKGYIK